MAKQWLICFFHFATGILYGRLTLSAQDSSYRVKMPWYVQASFFYDFPQSFGATASAEIPLKSKQIIKVFPPQQKEVKYRNLITTSTIGFYRYPFNHTGLFVSQAIGYRYYKNKPYYFEWLASIGLLRTIYDGTVYSVNNYNAVSILPNFGRYYATTGFTAVFGHDWARSSQPKPFAVDVRPSLWFQYPYNSFVLPHLSAQITFSYHLAHSYLSITQKRTIRSASR